MTVEQCAFCHNGSCNLLPEYYDNGLNYRFIQCEKIAISKCPYKLYIKGEITKEQLNDSINAILERKKKDE